MRTPSRRAGPILALAAIGILGGQSVGPGFAERLTPTSRIVRIEGHWRAAVQGGGEKRDALGTLDLATAADGTAVRPFEVMAVRSYHDADGGMEIFRKACLRPAVNLRGRSEVLALMVAVPAGDSMTLYGQFATGSSELLVSDVELPEDAADRSSSD